MFSSLPDLVDPSAAIADLRALARLSGSGAAERVAWTPEWHKARDFLRELVEPTGAAVSLDEAGNLWAALPGASDETVAVGSHLDSVPGGGWLDGALGVVAGAELLRAAAKLPEPRPRGLALVDWADEEGVRFGRALFGSAGATGHLDVEAVRDLRDAEGTALTTALRENGVDLDRLSAARRRLEPLVAYLELHVEQGPVLHERGESLAPVSGTVAVRRLPVRLTGRAEHVGPPPLGARRDAVFALGELIVAARVVSEREAGRTAVTVVEVDPNVPTIIAGAVEASVDLRHDTDAGLDAMDVGLRSELERIARSSRCEYVVGEPTFAAPAARFDTQLVAWAGEECAAAGGVAKSLVSGALHDATNVSRLVPTAMLFCASIDGVSHSPAEDTSDEDLRAGIRALAGLADRALGGGRHRPTK